MPPRVNLKVTQGKLMGSELLFESHTTCMIGRAKDCNVRLPDDQDHKAVSRHHCLVEINPPDARIRDLGSLNGTFVNGERIGKREKGQSPEEGARLVFPEYDLKQGDEIKVGNTVYRVDVHIPTLCVECRVEIPEDKRDQARISGEVYQCEECRGKAEIAKRREPPREKPKLCVHCGKDVSREIGANRQGDFLCAACKTNPLAILEMLLKLADAGKGKLADIQGYKIVKELGRGGMGAVYLARHEATGEQVALKVMLPSVPVTPYSRDVFLREVEICKCLMHSNVVRLRDSGCSDGTFYFTLEFCDSGSVDMLMRQRGGRLPVEEAVGIILQVLDGLEYAHSAPVNVKLQDGRTLQQTGVVHRDMKPANIFLTSSGGARVAKVADFGLAKSFEAAGLSGMTATGSAAGSPWFMPRQQVINFLYAKPDVDVWAIAASLYNMLTGRFPRDFPAGKDPWRVVLESAPVSIRKHLPSIPAKLAGVIDHALIDHPEIPIKTAAELKRQLQEAI